MNPKCPLCRNSTEFFSIYLFNVEHDQLYFGKPNIYRCPSCNLGCAHPEPDGRKVSFYYEKIYRSPGRPHYIDPASIPRPAARHFAALNALLPAIYAQKAVEENTDPIKILEIGAGWGEVGQLTKTLSANIEVTTIEPCAETQESLMLHGYNVATSISALKGERFDAVISLHVMEHFYDPHAFFNLFKDLTKQGGFLFLEVPNCPMNESFNERPYDSPHLSFWNKSCMLKLAKEFELELMSISSSGMPITEAFAAMARWKEIYRAWSPQREQKKYFNGALTLSRPKKTLKQIARKLKSLIGLQRITEKSKTESFDKDLYPFSPDGSQWCIRALYRFKK